MKTFFSVLIVLTILLAGWFSYRFFQKKSEFNELAKQHHFAIIQSHTLFGFDLLDPEEAPSSIHESVMQGYRLIMNTPFFAPEYAKDQLSCMHCHFFGGDTIGGKNNGISLVGVTKTYPKFSKRDNKVISLAERINNCFERSLNGRPLPFDSPEMIAILNYLQWISKEVEHLPSIPWLGLIPLKTTHRPDVQNGEKVYQLVCASCHKQDGEGGAVLIETEGKMIPPIWGPHSFNDGAGMTHLPTMASFIYWNMPYKDPSLTEEEAVDVAAFVLEQKRPHFIKEK